MNMRAVILFTFSFSVLVCIGCRTTGTGESPKSPEAGLKEKQEVQPTVRTEKQLARDRELEKEAAWIIDLYTNHSPAISRDGTRIAFISNREGLSQVYIASAGEPEKEPLRLSDKAERALYPRFTPDGKHVLYLSDVGANEEYRIWSASVDGGNPGCLTPEGDLWRDPPLVTDDGSTMIYTAAELKETRTILYTQSLDSENPKEVIRLDSRAFLEDISGDGSVVLLISITGFSDTELIIVDVKNATSRRLYPPEDKKATVSSAALSDDGKEVFVGTDGGGENAFLIKLDAAAGAQEAIYQELKIPTGVFDSIQLAGEGKKLFTVLNAGDHDEIRLISTKNMGPMDLPEIHLGSIQAGECGKMSTLCPLTLSVPDAPKDIFLFDISKACISPARKETRPELDKLPKVDVQIVSVPSTDGVHVPVNFYLPEDLPEGKRLPVIVSMHGGPAGSSQVNWNSKRLFYISQGYAFVEPNVRGSWGFGRAWEMADNGRERMKSIEDMGSVGKWVAQQPWADPERLVVYGGSYGGYMVLMGLAFQSFIWAAGVDIVGVSSVRTLLKTTSGSIREVLITEFGNLETDGIFIDFISPLNHTDNIEDPLFVYQGKNDPRVPRSESDQIVKALKDKGIPVEYMIMEKEGHSIDRRESKLEFLSRSARFLEEVLK